MIVKAPWGFQKILFEGGFYIVKELHIEKGKRISLQYHPEKTETMFLKSGEGWIYRDINGEELTQPFVEGQAYHVPIKIIHRIGASAESDLVVLEVSTPQKGEDSTVRLEDDYGRS